MCAFFRQSNGQWLCGTVLCCCVCGDCQHIPPFSSSSFSSSFFSSSSSSLIPYSSASSSKFLKNIYSFLIVDNSILFYEKFIQGGGDNSLVKRFPRMICVILWEIIEGRYRRRRRKTVLIRRNGRLGERGRLGWTSLRRECGGLWWEIVGAWSRVVRV